MKPNPPRSPLPALTKITLAGLVCNAASLWIQWASGDPAFPKFPPGPIFFLVVAGIVAVARRWWWTPLLATLVAALTTMGWFARLPAELLRLRHPEEVGSFAAGIFFGTALQFVALIVTDVAGIAAAIQNFRRSRNQAAPIESR